LILLRHALFSCQKLPASFRQLLEKRGVSQETEVVRHLFSRYFIQPPAPFERGKPFFRIECAERRYTGVLALLRLEQAQALPYGRNARLARKYGLNSATII